MSTAIYNSNCIVTYALSGAFLGREEGRERERKGRKGGDTGREKKGKGDKGRKGTKGKGKREKGK